MTDTPQVNTDIADYRLAVERHLSDLPAPIREDLLNGLEEHLAEVSADLEPGVPLSHLLGSPDTYARELRETVEIPKEGPAERFRQAVLMPAVKGAKGMSDRFSRGTGFADLADLRKALRPGWWVLRGVLAAMLVFYLFYSTRIYVRFPVFRTELFLLAFAIGATLFFVWLSLRIGVRSQHWSRGSQLLVLAGGLYLLYAGWATVGSTFIGNALPDTSGPTVRETHIVFETPTAEPTTEELATDPTVEGMTSEPVTESATAEPTAEEPTAEPTAESTTENPTPFPTPTG